jgi:hypothetical protein
MALSVNFSRKNCLEEGCLSENGRMEEGAWPAYKFVHGISFWKKGSVALDYRFTWQRYDMLVRLYEVGAIFSHFIFYKFSGFTFPK